MYFFMNNVPEMNDFASQIQIIKDIHIRSHAKIFFKKTCILHHFAIFNCFTKHYISVCLFQTYTNLHTYNCLSRFHRWKRSFPPMETSKSYVCFSNNV